MNQRTSLSIIVVIGALLFSSHGHAELPQKQISSNTNQTISFNGIPLGKAGVISALQKMCMKKKFNAMRERCTFTDNTSVILLDYEILGNAIATLTLGSDKALTKVVIDGSTQEMLALAEALEKKYGKPLKKSVIIKKEIGTQLDEKTFALKESKEAQLDKEIFVWIDDQGSRIIVESIYSDYNMGGVAIESSPAAVQNSAAKEVNKPAK